MFDNNQRFGSSDFVLDAAYERGCTFWDTADVYNELIGKWLKRTDKRNGVFIATKFGYYKDDRIINGDPKYVREAANSSLKKLGVSCIDLLYLHADMTHLFRTGKIKHIGLSEVSAATITRIAAVEVGYSPFNLEIEDAQIGVLSVCRELGITLIAYSPLGRGILTSQVKSAADFLGSDFRRVFPKYSDENFPSILKLAEGLKEIGKHHRATGGLVALAWLFAQGHDIIPILGTKEVKYLEENLGALNVKLAPEDLKHIRDYIEMSKVTKGDLYPAWGMDLAYADTPELGKTAVQT
ncbi:hypothetical protein PILCRDRAFT_98821 [Piloderma croceum F 1598]|uniref:NADP-dependent oxidoreductase domain-containing protein n=1 Tax=Piloderma croceum (strain F 1598) TaxID=765440 RepID=A0A0C3ETW6_PILCF|nr:hypothetical protein PILCRDRAFT_98821 [Piloderma croceum F 1598]